MESKTKILVVDDEEEICRLTESFLIKKDYDAYSAANGQQAIELVNKIHPKVVLLDIHLGMESGIDVLKQIKEIDKDIRVIMVTAMDDEANIRQSRANGADDYITKPFTTSYLNDFILQRISKLSR